MSSRKKTGERDGAERAWRTSGKPPWGEPGAETSNLAASGVRIWSEMFQGEDKKPKGSEQGRTQCSSSGKKLGVVGGMGSR